MIFKLVKKIFCQISIQDRLTKNLIFVNKILQKIKTWNQKYLKKIN